MLIDNIESFENNILEDVLPVLNKKVDTEIYKEYQISEMADIEKKFLNGIIRYVKPKKILEVGMAAGGSSLIILNAIKDIKDSKLYSVDYSTEYYKDKNKNSGWVVDEYFPNLKNKWIVNTGGPLAKFIENIGNDIDVCLLDTMHINPGEILDLLVVLPFMKKNGIIILHDTIFHMDYETSYHYVHSYTNGLIFSVLKGKKYMPSDIYIKNISNIGAVVLENNSINNTFEYFYILTFPWSYIPNDDDFVYIENIISKYYNEKLSNLFKDVTGIKRARNLHREVLNTIKNGNKFNNIVSNISNFIPFKKARQKFKNSLIYGKEIDERKIKVDNMLKKLIKE
ncbi:class I SAM-dependent methyltransferase [uncultured Brachyspira sp.]|uniref:O-methyltransferase n=1 Tax=uncultured Brachyspira sp. TaxID=221953 RepID=UPI0026049B02|nr:class I SAM-dependent methyltransferase [uncultured Brachyspira sp.]